MYRLLACLLLVCTGSLLHAEEKFRLGIIGTTTSHVPEFVKLLHAPNAPAPLNQFQVIAAYPGGMPDNPDSWNRVKQYADELEKQGIKLYPTIEAMLPEINGILLESVDGRPHLEQAKPVIAAGKPLFIDKPMAGSLADVMEIFRFAEEKKVPVFSASSLRYTPGCQKILNEKSLGKILGCDTWGPCSYNDKHPDLFWYGIHGIEMLYTMMGIGCQTVSRTHTQGTDVAVGVWDDGRIGTFRGLRTGRASFGATIFGETGIQDAGPSGGYQPLVVDFCKFFQTGEPPFDPQETIEIFAFMEAADASKAKGGMPVSIAETIAKAKAEVPIPVRLQISPAGVLQMDGKIIELGKLSETLDALTVGKPNARVKVILRAERDTSHETVLSVCNNLGKAMLADFLYER